MESTVLVLIGAVLFCQSWHVLDTGADRRSLGAIVGLLGLMALAVVAFDGAFLPSLLTTDGAGDALIHPLAVTAANNLMNAVIVVWGIYAVAVAVNMLFDVDDRAVGLYTAVVTGVTLVAFIYYIIELRDRYGEAVWIGLWLSMLVLALLGCLVFVYQALRFRILQTAVGWSMLVGGSGVALIGALIASEVILVKL